MDGTGMSSLMTYDKQRTLPLTLAQNVWRTDWGRVPYPSYSGKWQKDLKMCFKQKLVVLTITGKGGGEGIQLLALTLRETNRKSHCK